MPKILLASLMLLLVGMGLVVSSCSRDDIGSQTSKPQTTDAFSGEPINKNIYADYKGKRIYFCCVNSRRNFYADPERYIDRFRKLGITLENAPTIK